MMIIAKLVLVTAMLVPTAYVTVPPTAAHAQLVSAASPRPGCPASVVNIIKRDFGRSWSWAVGIAWRESRCQPGAANRRSQARGVFQLMVPLHWRDFAAVGCSWRQWANPTCNIGAAAHLFRGQGTSPWR